MIGLEEHVVRKIEIHPEARALALHMASIRDKYRLTNKDLASRMAISESSVKKLFTGEVHANFMRLSRLARAMGTTPNELLGFDAASETDRQARERGALEAVFAALGVPEGAIQRLVQAVLSAIEAHPLHGLTPEQSVRSRVLVELDRPSRQGLEQ